MVTIQEIEEREKSLKDVESQAKKVVRKPIPERRFGGGVSPRQQQQAVQRREEAKRVLGQVKEQRQSLSETKVELSRQIAEAESRRQQIQELEQQIKTQQAARKGRNLALEGKFDPGLSRAGREGYREGLAILESRQKQLEQLQRLESQGLKPIISGGKIVGFEDEIRMSSVEIKNVPEFIISSESDVGRYERAGVVQRQSQIQSNLPTLNEVSFKQSLPTDQRNQPLQTLAPPKQTFKQKFNEFLFGEKAKARTGIGIPGTKAFVSLQQIKDFATKNSREIFVATNIGPRAFVVKPSKQSVDIGSFAIRTGAQLIPTSRGEVILVGGSTIAAITVPATAPVLAGGFGAIGVKGALNKQLSAEQRAASGFVAVAGGVGVVAGGLPFARGVRARVSTDFKPIEVAPEGFKVIKGGSIPEEAIAFRPGRYIAKELGTENLFVFNKQFRGDIGLILEKSPLASGETVAVKLPSQSPLKRGGFGVKAAEKELFLGPSQKLATSQRGFFKEGTQIKIEREFFVSPQDPFKQIPVTRVSRLGLVKFFQKPKDIQLGLGLPKSPQIGIIRADIGRFETIKQFKIGSTSELEAIKSFGTIQEIKRIGRTTIRGQGVDIFEFKIGKDSGSKAIDISKELKKLEGSTRGGTSPISTEGLFSSLGVTQKTTITVTRVSQGSISSPLSSLPKLPSLNIRSERISPLPKPRTISSPIPTASTLGTSPPVSPPIKPPKLPELPGLTPDKPGRPRKRKKGSGKKRGDENDLGVPGFRPFVLRKGEKVFLGGIFPKAKALKLAETEAKGTLRATFGVEPTTLRVKGPKTSYTPPKNLFRSYRIRKGKRIPLKDTYIQRLGKRLSFKGEVRELQRSRKRR